MGELTRQQAVDGQAARLRHGSFLVAVEDFLMAAGTGLIRVGCGQRRGGPQHNSHQQQKRKEV